MEHFENPRHPEDEDEIEHLMERRNDNAISLKSIPLPGPGKTDGANGLAAAQCC